ncbi:dihydrodipicolinate synthase family protein [Corynebacterium sp.]|uniref:dihydrodipicolinate synthase family protein n=1 Tax=Corynebacterium sp. TaxID=1720 RepID=UPI00345DFC74
MTLNNTADLRGVLTALSTPFDADENIDVDLLKKVVDRSIDNGVDGVVAGGSTGEFAMMTDAEREQLVDTVAGHTGVASRSSPRPVRQPPDRPSVSRRPRRGPVPTCSCWSRPTTSR